MPLDLAKFETDPDKIKGVWFKYQDDDADEEDDRPVEFLIAYWERPAFFNATGRLQEQSRFSAKQQKAKPGLRHYMMVETIADSVLMDWKNVEHNGVAIPATRENKIVLLSSQRVRSWIQEKSEDLAHYRKEAIAKDAADLKSGHGVATEAREE
jgi:hypothetical protein